MPVAVKKDLFKIPPVLLKKLPVSRLFAYGAALFIMLFLFDISRMPDRQITAKVLLWFIGQYQKYVSHRLTGIIHCKFQPTCSHYGKTSIEWYGAYWGTIKAADRIFRCSPWTEQSGWDPP